MATTETEKPVIKQGSPELVYAEVVVSLATAVGLLVLTVIQLVYRTARRARFLWRSENQIRFDAAHFLSKPEGNKSRKIIMMGLKEHENRDLKPPPLVLPSVFANDRDVQADCLAMVAETREIFRKQYGESACLMSMRCCLSCVENALPSNQTEEFLRIYESVLFGQHRIGVTSDDVTNDDIRTFPSMSVTIKLSNGTQKNVDVPDLSITVARFKEIASDVTNIPADEQRVVLRGRVLKDDDILSVMGLEHGQALHIVRGQKSKKQDVNPAPPPAAPTRQEAQTHSSAQPVQETINPYTALAANSPATGGLSGNNLGNTNAGFPVSPDFMSTMMQNPMFMQFFQERMRDPQFLNQAMQQRQDPLGMSGGEIQRLLSNPMFMQLVMQMMSDPTAMQQMAQSMGGGFPSSNAPLFGQPNTQGMNPMLNAGAPQPRGDSRVLYQSQLQQLREMGFPNEEANLAALEQAQGNIDFAIERLLNA